MTKPNPDCEDCKGTGKIPAVLIDIHGDGMHDCHCRHEDIEMDPDKMTIEELREEVKMWRSGGQD